MTLLLIGVITPLLSAELSVTDAMISGGVYNYDMMAIAGWTDKANQTGRDACAQLFQSTFSPESFNAYAWAWSGAQEIYVTPWDNTYGTAPGTAPWNYPPPPTGRTETEMICVQTYNFGPSSYAVSGLTASSCIGEYERPAYVDYYYRAIYADGKKVFEETLSDANGNKPSSNSPILLTWTADLSSAPATKVVFIQKSKKNAQTQYNDWPYFNWAIPGDASKVGFVASFNVVPVSNRVSIVQTGGNTTVNEGGASDTYTIVLNQAPASNVTIAVEPTIEPNKTINVGSGLGVTLTLTFTPANWSTPQTVTVSAPENSLRTGDYTSACIHHISSDDINYNQIAVRNFAVQVIDNDLPTFILAPVTSPLAVHERGATSAQFRVSFSALCLAPVSVSLAADAAQMTVSPATLNFTTANWATPQTVTVTALNDTETETYTQSFPVTATAESTDAGFAGLTGSINVSVLDNDCGAWSYQASDINQDCQVNLLDLFAMTSSWLVCTTPETVNCVNLVP